VAETVEVELAELYVYDAEAEDEFNESSFDPEYELLVW
jgi:hypothetical protein